MTKLMYNIHWKDIYFTLIMQMEYRRYLNAKRQMEETTKRK